MGDNNNTLNWQSLSEYLKQDFDTPVPVHGSDNCVLVVKPSMGLELQIRDRVAYDTEISSLPNLSRFHYEIVKTVNYCYLAIKCEIPDLLEAVLDFFYSIVSKIVNNKCSARNAIAESYDEYKAILSQPLAISQEVIQGLWGELFTIQLVLNNTKIDPNSIILNWTGPLGQPNDFSFGNTAIEVKTITKQTNIIEISSFDQLDADHSWLIIIHAFHAHSKEGGLSISFLTHLISEKLTANVKEILHARIDNVVNSLNGPFVMNFSMKPDGLPIIVEMRDSIPLLTRRRLNSVFGENRAKLIEKGKYVLNLSSVEFTKRTIDDVFFKLKCQEMRNP